MDLDTGVLLLAGVAVLAGAVVQGCVGLGLGLVAAPVMASIIVAASAAVLILFI